MAEDRNLEVPGKGHFFEEWRSPSWAAEDRNEVLRSMIEDQETWWRSPSWVAEDRNLLVGER